MDRKEFLKSIGCMAALTTLPAIPSLAKIVSSPEGDEEKLTSDDSDVDAKLDKPVTVIIIGAGSRGKIYASYAEKFPGSMKVVGVADINEFRRDFMADKYAIPQENRMGDWSEVFRRPRFADAVVIATPDRLHYEPYLEAIKAGYHILLEKPMAPTEKECKDIVRKALASPSVVAVCHVLRYSPYFKAMRDVIMSGKIGNVLSMQHLEPIGAVRFAHSYARGKYGNSQTSSPIILAKSCHDLDLLYWMTGKRTKEVAAFGDLSFFRRENLPEGAGERCLECAVEKECAYSAKRLYYDLRQRTGVFDLTGNRAERGEQILEYLRTTNYGKCAFRLDNDQCDHYTMILKFQDDTTASFSMEGMTSYNQGRITRIMGTQGDIVGDMVNFTVTDYLTGNTLKYESGIRDEHAGGDMRIVRDFVSAVSKGDKSLVSSLIQDSLESHMMGFNAEKSRKTGKLIKM
jgi:predicted dehydrogenase